MKMVLWIPSKLNMFFKDAIEKMYIMHCLTKDILRKQTDNSIQNEERARGYILSKR